MLVETPTEEIDNPLYQENRPDRCFHCKTELYDHVRSVADRHGIAEIANGSNADDAGDHRPGMLAAAEHRVHSPLLECGLGKEAVRSLARHWGLPVWDKPAAPCLASRIAYGQEVTPERLTMIDGAEQYLRGLGLREFRVRFHEGDLARIEAPIDEITRLAGESIRPDLVGEFQKLGFKRVTLDLAGFHSGSLNTLVPSESLRVIRDSRQEAAEHSNRGGL